MTAAPYFLILCQTKSTEHRGTNIHRKVENNAIKASYGVYIQHRNTSFQLGHCASDPLWSPLGTNQIHLSLRSTRSFGPLKKKKKKLPLI